jgi:hypothetical protein
VVGQLVVEGGVATAEPRRPGGRGEAGVEQGGVPRPQLLERRAAVRDRLRREPRPQLVPVAGAQQCFTNGMS